MLNDNNRQYVSWGITALVVVVLSLLLSFFISRFGAVRSFAASILNILMPVIYGALMAFLMAPAYNTVCGALVPFLAEKVFRGGKGAGRRAYRVARFTATFVCIAVIVAFVNIIIALIIPQIISGISDLANSMPTDTASAASFIRELLKGKNENIANVIISAGDRAYSWLSNWIHMEFLPNINTYLSQMTSGIVKVLNVVKNFFIGLIIMAYALNMKELLSAQTKRILYAFFPVTAANSIVSEARYVKNVFTQFIVGKIIDSIIIGILCYICLCFMRMPFALVISTFVGVTNVIPFFGPFIGAIPSAFILLIVSPMKALQFCVFILILQQFDGNILGPKILGSATGISSFWVLFSILFFGGLWGIVGMVIGIPTFAVLARFLQRLIERQLEKRKLPLETPAYDRLDRIDPVSGEPSYHDVRKGMDPGGGEGKRPGEGGSGGADA